jgi:peptide-methionine (R)-S-oxide reductase
LLAAPLAGASWLAQAQKKGITMVEELQNNWKTFLAAGTAVPSAADAVKLSKDEWRKRLSPASYNVLREDGTERAGTSPLDREKRAGVFACAGCDLPLFTSAMKFDSGTGWPSFFTTIPDVFTAKTDYYLIYPRTEYRCKRCDGHHGHLFKDGPPPTGLRYCNNGVALKFISKDGKA